MSQENPEPIVVPPVARRRRAYVCYEKDGTIHQRRFLLANEDFVPRCEQHGPMRVQPNVKYKGRTV